MEKIEIYSSKKKSFIILIASLLFIAAGIYMFIDAENFTGSRISNPLVIKAIGIISVLFFGLAMYFSIRLLIKNQLILIIDKNGLNVNPKKSLTEYIKWKNINGFSELKIQSQKLVIIDVDNADYWIEKEQNGLRKKLIKYNVTNYGSPFNLSANSMQLDYDELLKLLNDNLKKHKYNG